MIPMEASFKAGKKTVEADLYAIVGAGSARINSSWEPHGFIGGGMKIYILKWMAIRVDLRNNLHSINKPDGTNKFEQDLDLLTGISFQIPPMLFK
jgi:hypothetical protein